MNKSPLKFAGAIILSLFMGSHMVKAQDDTLFLDLESAINLALEQNQNIRVATLEMERAQARLNESRGRLLPTVQAMGSYNRNIKKPVIFLSGEMAEAFRSNTLEIGADNSFMGALSVSMPIFNPAINSGIEMSRTEMLVAGENYRASKIDLTYNVQRVWFDALLARESLEIIRLSFDNAQRNHENIRQMFNQGLVAEFDLIRAEVQTENIRPEVLQAENMYGMVKSVLKTLLGVDQNRPIAIGGNLTETSDQMLASFNIMQAERSLIRNSQLVGLDLQHQLLVQRSGSLRASRAPSVNAMSNYNYQTESNDFRFQDFNWVNTIAAGFQINIPIFAGLTNRNQIKQLDIGARQVKLQREYLENNLSVELENILNSMNVAVERAIHAERNVEMAQRGYDIALVRYNSGQGTLLEVNDSEVALTRARFNLLQARHQILNQKIQYDRFIGGDQ